jgi:hypothetical protein
MRHKTLFAGLSRIGYHGIKINLPHCMRRS